MKAGSSPGAGSSKSAIKKPAKEKLPKEMFVLAKRRHHRSCLWITHQEGNEYGGVMMNIREEAPPPRCSCRC